MDYGTLILAKYLASNQRLGYLTVPKFAMYRALPYRSILVRNGSILFQNSVQYRTCTGRLRNFLFNFFFFKKNFHPKLKLPYLHLLCRYSMVFAFLTYVRVRQILFRRGKMEILGNSTIFSSLFRK